MSYCTAWRWPTVRKPAGLRRVEAMAHGRGTGSMRVDTNFDNRYMLRMLGRLGFVYCGKVRYRSGERLAFEKPLGT